MPLSEQENGELLQKVRDMHRAIFGTEARDGLVDRMTRVETVVNERTEKRAQTVGLSAGAGAFVAALISGSLAVLRGGP